ncbi:L-rhamnose mutarotase [Paenibacillus aceris]|uniref:L-rhamnose mutarotase n=1 Tax=Paenibacillus aceris TaxID=869555 RepID=A0ABS4I5F1_9BACL|nr:L-rhamnose mutarotase [Paenibacillus aceris]MBP1965334.1 L-rhamnose mutarotase [Paenibacillus aceris]NHW36014.1 L-rhamnose mutarotase [Paenibacillus aceris]
MSRTISVKKARLKEHMLQQYIKLHDEIADTIVTNLRTQGIVDLKIYRHGLDIWMIFTIDEQIRQQSGSFDESAEAIWQQETGECFDCFWEDAELVYTLSKRSSDT